MKTVLITLIVLFILVMAFNAVGALCRWLNEMAEERSCKGDRYFE